MYEIINYPNSIIFYYFINNQAITIKSQNGRF